MCDTFLFLLLQFDLGNNYILEIYLSSLKIFPIYFEGEFVKNKSGLDFTLNES